MKILTIGGVVFVFWSLFSVWLYVNKLMPAMNNQVATQPIPAPPDVVTDSVSEADSISQPEVLEPNDLLIYFKFDDAGFSRTSQTDNTVNEFISWIDKYPESVISITGHADNVGSSEYNKALGLERARTIQKYFYDKGLKAENLATNSQGEDQPVAEQSSEEGRAKNRRVVVTIKN